MNTPVLKIFGERNTGTNYLHKLVELNLSVFVLSGTVPRRLCFTESMRDMYIRLTRHNNLGWKHGMPLSHTLLEKYGRRITRGKLVFLTLTKNPYSWLLSLYKRPYNSRKKYGSLQDFIRKPWLPVKRDNYPGVFINPVDMWNKKNSAYLNLKKYFPCANLRYEDLLKHPSQAIRRVAEEFQLPMQEFRNVTESTKENHKNFSYYRDYYLTEKWREKLDRRSINLINQYLDNRLMQLFDYRKL
ncbi:hypothetical protein JW935_12900 [candidate division KSB1 bacterium]|nr:hypothetical protein [candidate division KSB1 bacterium]